MRVACSLLAVLTLWSVPATLAQDLPKVTVAMSGWTGFAPLSLAEKTGLFKKNGVDVTIKFIPQKDRHLAIASGDVQCAATTVETWIAWNANGVATKQVLQLDKSYGADGMVVRKDVAKIADLKGKTVAASAPGTAPYFTLAWMLKKNGLSVKDVKVMTLEPGPAAQAFIAGQGDAAMTYEPYLSSVRDKPDAGKIIATTLDYPMIMDTFGCTPKFIQEQPKLVQAMVDSYFEAVQMIKQDPKKSFEIMGRGGQADGRAVREVAGVPPVAGPRGEQEVLRGRAPGVQPGGRGPSARARHHQEHAGHRVDRGYPVRQVRRGMRAGLIPPGAAGRC